MYLHSVDTGHYKIVEMLIKNSKALNIDTKWSKKQYEDEKKRIEQDKQLKTIHMSEGNYKKEVKNIAAAWF